MTPLFVRTTTWGKLRADINLGVVPDMCLRPIMVWGRAIDDLEAGLYGIPFIRVRCAEFKAVPLTSIAIIADPEERGAKLATLCGAVRATKRTMPTLIPVSDQYCKAAVHFPFPANAITHVRVQDV